MCFVHIDNIRQSIGINPKFFLQRIIYYLSNYFNLLSVIAYKTIFKSLFIIYIDAFYSHLIYALQCDWSNFLA